MYYGSSDGYSFAHVVDVGNSTNCLLPAVLVSEVIAVTAYDTGGDGVDDRSDGHESWFTSAVLATNTLPSIASQPSNQTASVGDPAAFTVTAVGTSPLAYQWRKNGVDLSDGGRISGAATTNLAIANVQTSDAGSYTVVVTNGYGSVTSQVAVLTVNRLDQTISFAALGNRTYGDAPFMVSAAASSGNGG